MSIAPLGIALIGAGRIGQLHARNMIRNPRARLLCVLEQDTERAKSVVEMAGCQMVSEFEEAIDFPGVEALYISSPTDTHVGYILRSVEAGKYVFCEKPVDLDLERAKACVQQLGDRATQVMMGFNRRFDPSLAAMRQAVRGGDIGALEQIVVISRDPTPPPQLYLSQSGGIFRDMTIPVTEVVHGRPDGRSASLLRSLPLFGIDPDSDRTIVDQVDRHVRSEHTALDRAI
jgi:myo-inositol 2-dehydrogenase / D-chiro-inositol 1-dehydrogenase